MCDKMSMVLFMCIPLCILSLPSLLPYPCFPYSTPPPPSLPPLSLALHPTSLIPPLPLPPPPSPFLTPHPPTGQLLAPLHHPKHRTNTSLPTERQAIHRPPPEHTNRTLPSGRLPTTHQHLRSNHRARWYSSHEALHAQRRRGDD